MINENNNKRSSFGCTEILILVFFTCLFGIGLGYFLGTQNKEVYKMEKDPYIDKFVENYNYIINNYYKKVDKSSLVDHAVKGMVESLGDDFSNYIDQTESGNFDATLNGSYEGIGITIVQDKEGNIVIIDVIQDSPAYKAGLKALDVLRKIGKEEVTGKETKEVTNSIKSSKQKSFTLTIERDGKEIEMHVTRENITLQSVDHKMIEKEGKKIGYIYIDIFALNTNDQFKEALKELEKQGMQSLIIDVRDNGGGHLIAAKQIASNLLDKSHVIYQTETKGKKEKTYADGKTTKKYPIVFLTNENTASGSEVLVAALKENVGAVSIGTKSYGKGTVQELIGLSTGSQYKVTVKKWLTPKGNWINEKGIEPNINSILSEEYKNDPKEENDNQLRDALEYLKDK